MNKPLIADEFFRNEKTQAALQDLVESLAGAQEKITATKTASQDYSKNLQHLYNVRGRNLYYPYVGSGMGHGPFVELMDGSVKLDLIGGIGIHLFGHSHPMVVKAALEGALQDVVMQGNLQPNREYGELLDLLVGLAGRKSRIKKGWIGTCGTIVNENALKIARQKNTPARKILAFNNAFAGRSTLMAEITDNPEYRQGLPEYNEVLYVPFYDKKNPQSSQNAYQAMKKHIEENPKNIACFMFEIVQGEGGFNYGPKEFYVPLFELCKKNNIAIWADEVQTFSRTGEMFAFEKFDLGEYIDIVTLAKTAQCGAVLYTEEYNPKPGLIAGTYTASTTSLRVGIQIIKTLIEDNYLGKNGKIDKINHAFVGMLQSLKEGSCKEYISDFDGVGLMVSMTPYDGSKEKVTKLLQELFKNGLMAFSCGHGPYKVRFLLPAILEKEHIEQTKNILEKTILECK